MDSEIYKILKQLVKLGIINGDTKIIRRRKPRQKRSRYNQPSTMSQQQRGSNVTTHYPPNSSTVQSEQAINNLRVSEIQLQRALKNED